MQQQSLVTEIHDRMLLGEQRDDGHADTDDPCGLLPFASLCYLKSVSNSSIRLDKKSGFFPWFSDGSSGSSPRSLGNGQRLSKSGPRHAEKRVWGLIIFLLTGSARKRILFSQLPRCSPGGG